MAAADRAKAHAPSASRLLRAKEAAAMLAISPRKLWGLTRSGKIPCVRIGSAVRYVEEDLHKFIQDRRCCGGSF